MKKRVETRINNGVEERRCNECGEWKIRDEYYQCRENWIDSKCKTCRNIINTLYRSNNREKTRAMVKKADTNEKVKLRVRKSRAKGVYREWQRNNPDKVKQYAVEHNKHHITKDEWENCKGYFNNKCAYCGLDINDHYVIFKQKQRLGDFHKEHVEHNGANDLSNCVPACKVCNSSKRKRSLNEWYNIDNERYNLERYNKIIKWITEDYKEYIERK